MKRKLLAPLLCIVLVGALLAGCGGGDDAPKTFSVTVENSTIYTFNELYVSATALPTTGEVTTWAAPTS